MHLVEVFKLYVNKFTSNISNIKYFLKTEVNFCQEKILKLNDSKNFKT